MRPHEGAAAATGELLRIGLAVVAALTGCGAGLTLWLLGRVSGWW